MKDQAANYQDTLYSNLAIQIEQEIARGKFSSGDKLYSIQQIRKRFGVSRSTAERTIGVLKQKGIIKSYPKKGNFVCAVPNIQISPVKRKS